MSWTVWETDLDEIHVIPTDEEHSHTALCWCKPTLDGNIFVHHSADRREYTTELN